MMNPHRKALLAALKLSDLIVVTVVFVATVAFATPGEDGWVQVLNMRIQVRNVLFLFGYLGYWHLVLNSFGLYRSYRLSPSSREWRDLGTAVLVGATPVWALGDVLRFQYATHTFMLLFAVATFACVGLERRLFRSLARSM